MKTKKMEDAPAPHPTDNYFTQGYWDIYNDMPRKERVQIASALKLSNSETVAGQFGIDSVIAVLLYHPSFKTKDDINSCKGAENLLLSRGLNPYFA